MSRQNKNVSRRRSRSLVGFACKDLCETVPKCLSSTERLMMLLEKSFLYALSTVQKEVMSKEDFDIIAFRQKGAKSWERIKAVIEEKNLDKSAVEENGLCESYVEAKVEGCNEAIALMEAESKKWSDQISYYRECLKNEIESSYSVRSSESEQSQLYDYSDIMRDMSTMEKTIVQQIHGLSSVETTVKDCFKYCKIYDSVLRRECEKYYHQSISSTPRTVIRRFALSRRNIKPYSVYK